MWMPWFRARVRGPSMAPTLKAGDWVLARRTRSVRAGDVVVAVFRSRPDLLVVKRTVDHRDGGWWLRSDNEFVSDDSRSYGVADVVGRVVLRYRPAISLIRRGAR